MAMLKAGYYTTHPDKQDELQLLKCSKSPDFLTARSAADALIRSNEGFLKNTVWGWSESGLEFNFNEVLAEANLAFYESILHFDLSYDVSIRTYSRYRLLELRKQLSRKNQWVEFQPTHVIETCTIGFDDFKVLDLSQVLSEALTACLTPIEREVVYLHYIKGIKKRKIAKQRNCSEARISTIVKNALPKLRFYLMERGIEPGLFEQQ